MLVIAWIVHFPEAEWLSFRSDRLLEAIQRIAVWASDLSRGADLLGLVGRSVKYSPRHLIKQVTRGEFGWVTHTIVFVCWILVFGDETPNFRLSWVLWNLFYLSSKKLFVWAQLEVWLVYDRFKQDWLVCDPLGWKSRRSLCACWRFSKGTLVNLSEFSK